MDWFLYDIGLRRERVNLLTEAYTCLMEMIENI